MGTLEIVMLVLWVICILVNLFLRKRFLTFAISSISDAIILGVVYVIIHLAIRHW